MTIIDDKAEYYKREVYDELEHTIARMRGMASVLEEANKLGYLDKSVINRMLNQTKYIRQNLPEALAEIDSLLVRLKLTLFYQDELAKEQHNE